MITKTDLTIDELIESMTGHEENDCYHRFGGDVLALLEGERSTWAFRGLIYVATLRDLKAQDVNDPATKAFEHSMDMTIKQVHDFFAEDEPTGDDAPAVTPVGKDESSPA